MEVLGQERREGLGRKSESRIGLNVCITASLFLLLSSLYAAEASVFRKARESALEAASPVLQLLAGPIAKFEDLFGSFSDYVLVLRQNKSLREENAALRQWMNELHALREVVASYHNLGVYKMLPENKPVIGFVVGESNDAFIHSMIVNVGRADGVARGQAVVDDQGLIGHIVEASSNASRVLLLNDAQSRIPIYVEGALVDGILIGRTDAQPVIGFTRLADLARVEVGQRVWTSGSGGVLPRGLAVGVVAEVTDKEARVRLDANYVRTRMVRIVSYSSPIVEENDPANSGVIARQPSSTVSAPDISASSPTATIPAREPTPALPGEDEEVD